MSVKWRKHLVERLGQVLELVAGLDLGTCLDVATRHVVAHVAQVLERLDDHVTNDDVRRQHRQKHRHDRRRNQDGAVLVNRDTRGRVGHGDLHHAQEIAHLKHAISRAPAPINACPEAPLDIWQLMQLPSCAQIGL